MKLIAQHEASRKKGFQTKRNHDHAVPLGKNTNKYNFDQGVPLRDHATTVTTKKTNGEAFQIY